MKKYYRVVIPPTAKESLQEIVKHIKQDSPTAAIKVRKTLLEKAKSLKELPERFSREMFLIDKPGIIVLSPFGIIKLFIRFWMMKS